MNLLLNFAPPVWLAWLLLIIDIPLSIWWVDSVRKMSLTTDPAKLLGLYLVVAVVINFGTIVLPMFAWRTIESGGGASLFIIIMVGSVLYQVFVRGELHVTPLGWACMAGIIILMVLLQYNMSSKLELPSVP